LQAVRVVSCNTQRAGVHIGSPLQGGACSILHHPCRVGSAREHPASPLLIGSAGEHPASPVPSWPTGHLSKGRETPNLPRGRWGAEAIPIPTTPGVRSDQDFEANPAVATRALQDEQRHRYLFIRRAAALAAQILGPASDRDVRPLVSR
jgi:hypothetical protein